MWRLHPFPLVFLSLFLWFPYLTDGTNNDCIPRLYSGQTSVVCVCNSTYCDVIEDVKTRKPGKYIVYTSTMQGLRFEKYEGSMKPMSDYTDKHASWPWHIFQPAVLEVNRSETYQKLFGFGGSFTDATSINIAKLSKKAQDNLMQAYFGKDGLEFNMGRVPIGGTDFSTHKYAYNEWPEDDKKLSNFSLTEEDLNLKIPHIKEAQKLATDEILLICSVWSPPIWMKNNHDYHGQSYLLKKYYQTFANYHVRFLEEYEKNNILFWGVTTGNEPFAGHTPFYMNSLGWLPNLHGYWIEKHFGPTIRRSRYKDIKILSGDDDRAYTQLMMEWMVDEYPKALDYIDGVATHSYLDKTSLPLVHENIHQNYPDKFLISTETAIGSLMTIEKMLFYFNQWITGVINWNLVTDVTTGGPAWTNLRLDALIMADSEQDEFIKLPIFYAFGHFSKFLSRGSVRVKLDVVQGNIECVAFMRPDRGITVIFYNPSSDDRQVTIIEEGKGFMKIDVPNKSIQTVVYW